MERRIIYLKWMQPQAQHLFSVADGRAYTEIGGEESLEEVLEHFQTFLDRRKGIPCELSMDPLVIDGFKRKYGEKGYQDLGNLMIPRLRG